MLESLAKIIERAEERASEREERIRRMELEMEERMREREERRDMQMFAMITGALQRICGDTPGSSAPFFQPPYQDQPPTHFSPQTPLEQPQMAPFSPTPSPACLSHCDYSQPPRSPQEN